MSQVVYLKAISDPSVTPCFVLIDLQREYVAGSRLLAMPRADAPLAYCRTALDHARAMGFPIAYVRQITRSPYFNPATDFSAWISGFEPSATDMIFDRDKPSCYSNRRFAELMDSCGGHFVMAGFAGETACLSTAVDAYHRNHRFTYLTDASASHKLGTFSAMTVQHAVAEIINVYGRAIDTDRWIAETSDTVALSRDEADV